MKGTIKLTFEEVKGNQMQISGECSLELRHQITDRGIIIETILGVLNTPKEMRQAIGLALAMGIKPELKESTFIDMGAIGKARDEG